MNNNEKKERFETSSAKRLDGVLSALKVLGNCSNLSAYEYSKEDVGAIFNIIRKRTDDEEAKFKPTTLDSWKAITDPLRSHAESSGKFQKVLGGGQHRLRFMIESSPIWVTCYSTNFSDSNKRKYGIFLSYTGIFDERNKTNTKKNTETKQVNFVSEKISKQRDDIEKTLRPLKEKYDLSIDLSGEKGYSGLVGAAGRFPSDEEAVDWLINALDKFADLFIPIINEYKQ